ASNWATAKLIGWFVLLSYAATGATLARAIEIGAGNRVALTIGTSGAAIVAFDVVVGILGVQLSRMVGFAGNSNAFAFELLMCLAASFVFLRDRPSWMPISSALMLGIVLTQSRAGLITLACTLILCGLLRRETIPQLLKAMFVALLAFALLEILSLAIDWIGLRLGHLSLGFRGPLDVFQRADSDIEVSNTERWRTISVGFRMFMAHPLIGAGLGNF